MKVEDNRSGSSVSEQPAKTSAPLWLLVVYITLLAWGLWHVIRYWD